MSLVEQLSDDMKEAMRSKDKLRLSVIRMVRAAIKNKEIDSGAVVSDEDALAIVQKELKQRRDSLQAFESAGRTDLADTAKDEIAILESYLPQQLSEDEIRTLVAKVIETVDAKGKSDMGKVMAALMPQVRGRADGKLVQQVVQTMLV